eukprot:CAMPEP_0201597232 /NCGR_PEP_ID=MMETSP0190_2-20130828/193782_1 /ASSEMBLY_ACC=CAM_ASM_000263 /TAXON_ID=37353 /ORGANISM="Rosalina sp." /LENGTH=405 /DNA_ID=CAMNT_0048058107 /DNA_START=643 /DNA_END=1860 /DNA_ORIENTATION=-
MNIESEKIERFTTPSYRSPEMIDLYQRKELSTKVDIWALGCVLFLLAYYEHPFPEGAKMSILDAKYKIPDKNRYSKKVSKLIKMLFNKEPTKRPTCKQISEHLSDIISGGKGTLSSKSKKRSNSQAIDETHLHLSPKKKDENRRKSFNATPEEFKSDAIDEGWDPFDDNEDDPFGGDNFDTSFQVASSLKPKDVKQQYNPNGNASNGKGNSINSSQNTNNNNNNNNYNSNQQNDNGNDPFFSADFAADFFGDASNNNNNGRPSSAKASSSPNKKPMKKRKSGSKPKPIDSEVYNEHQRRQRKKKREKPSRSRSKSPTNRSKKNSKSNSQNNRPTTPKVQKSPKAKPMGLAQAKPLPKQSQDPAVTYGDQLAQLVAMGFDNEEKNIKAILRAKGNVQVAVNILIAG